MMIHVVFEDPIDRNCKHTILQSFHTVYDGAFSNQTHRQIQHHQTYPINF